mgnify:FL=1
MNTLLIDTTYESCSASIVDNNMHCHYSFNDANKLQSETITEVVFDTIDKSGVSLKDIKNIIVTNGPGNFTSIRVGVSFALGVAKGISLPLYSLSSLELLSIFSNKEISIDKKFISIMPSRAEEFFVQAFDNNGNRITNILKITKNDMEKKFSPEEYFVVINSLQKEIIHLDSFDLIARSFKDMSLDLMFSLEKKKIKLNKLKDINYFSEPAAEKVKSSWYMKKIK